MERDAQGHFIKGHKGYMNPETAKKISTTCKSKGIGKWMKGRKMSEESKVKQRANTARYWLGKLGKEHPAWKDSKSNPLYLTIRSCFKYRQWRSDVFTRDNFTCVLCGRSKEVSGKLEADHFPKQFIHIIAEYNIQTIEEAFDCEELWNINNGRTLCRECHNPTRGKGRDTRNRTKKKK